MAISPLPTAGDTSWRDDWALDVHNVVTAVDAGTYATASHTHPATGISDSTAVGRSVLTAATTAAARTAIGAGTSSLAIGTTSTTAKAGDYAPAAATTAASGIVELADTTETTTGTDTVRAVTPAGLKAVADTKVTRVFTKRTVAGAYTLVAADATDMVLHSTSATGFTITLPQDTAATISQEVAIPWRQYGAGQITFAAGTGATLLSRGSVFKSSGQYAEGVVTKVAANTWLLSGDITA